MHKYEIQELADKVGRYYPTVISSIMGGIDKCYVTFLGVGLLCLMLTATPSKADPPADCLDIKSVESTLMARYRESKIFVGYRRKVT
jgi:hypothetical protein